MGTYLNPGNSGFSEILDTGYIDKTGMVELINERINTLNKLICISRPRRFGKSIAAQMLCAYYDHTCDSHSLFDDKEVRTTEQYEKHINKYNVIYLDMSNLLSKVKPEELITFIEDNITSELLSEYPEVKTGTTFDQTLIHAVDAGKAKFITKLPTVLSPGSRIEIILRSLTVTAGSWFLLASITIKRQTTIPVRSRESSSDNH